MEIFINPLRRLLFIYKYALQKLSLGRGIVSWSRSYENLAFYQCSCWPKIARMIGYHTIERSPLGIDVLTSDLASVHADHSVTDANRRRLLFNHHNSTDNP